MFFPFLTDSAAPGFSMSTSVDRALQVEEILGTIFRHLSPYVWDRKAVLTVPTRVNLNHGKDFSHLGVDALPCMENQTALVQCARVSRTIGPHALKVLWRTLPDIQIDECTRLADHFHQGYGVFMDLTGNSQVAALVNGFVANLKVIRGTISQDGIGGLLVRPDGVVAWAATHGNCNVQRLEAALTRWFVTRK